MAAAALGRGLVDVLYVYATSGSMDSPQVCVGYAGTDDCDHRATLGAITYVLAQAGLSATGAVVTKVASREAELMATGAAAGLGIGVRRGDPLGLAIFVGATVLGKWIGSKIEYEISVVAAHHNFYRGWTMNPPTQPYGSPTATPVIFPAGS
jgi:hypothetical protein